jgi:hypothetical protein
MITLRALNQKTHPLVHMTYQQALMQHHQHIGKT